jgi:hypothetical protein
MTLEYLLSADMSQRNGPILSLKFRMLFALPLALNLPQPIQTQWLEGAWSKGVVYPMLRPTGFGIGRPFVSLTFDDSTLNTKRSPSVQPKVVLLELGIFLLEIWQETGLGDRFSLEKAPTGYYQRLVLAVEWLEDADNPLLDRYDKPVSHCIQRAIGESHLADW